MSKRLLDAETRYPELEKLALALMVASRKLRPLLSCTPDRHLNQLPSAPSATKAGSLRQAPQVGDRVWAVRCEFSPTNDNKRTSLSRIHSIVHLLQCRWSNWDDRQCWGSEGSMSKGNRGLYIYRRGRWIVDPICRWHLIWGPEPVWCWSVPKDTKYIVLYALDLRCRTTKPNRRP